MPTNTRSSKLSRQSSDVVLLSDPADIVAAKRAPLPKQKQNTARKENHCPVVTTGEIIEISSDEDEEPVAKSTVATSKLKERIRLLEKENARIKKENEEIKKRQSMAADVEDQATQCEVCSTRMWSPFILPDCGHTFCQQDLEDWFSTALKQHRTMYPHYNVNAPAVNVYGFVQALPLPPYSCPKCREKVRSKPIQNFALKGLVRVVADKVGENSPKKTTAGGPTNWSRFFPAQQ